MYIFDWDKAAKIIKERNPKRASAGLREDWFWTAGCIWSHEKPDFDSYTFLASEWAEPILRIGNEEIPCGIYLKEFDLDIAEVKWPKSALAILELL